MNINLIINNEKIIYKIFQKIKKKIYYNRYKTNKKVYKKYKKNDKSGYSYEKMIYQILKIKL